MNRQFIARDRVWGFDSSPEHNMETIDVMTDLDKATLLEMLKDSVQRIENDPHDRMEDASWGYEEGILISGNEAKYIVSVLEA